MLDVWNHLTVKCFVLFYGRCKVVYWLSFEHLPSCRPTTQKRIMPPLLILPKICEDIYGADTSNIALSSSHQRIFFSQKRTGIVMLRGPVTWVLELPWRNGFRASWLRFFFIICQILGVFDDFSKSAKL